MNSEIPSIPESDNANFEPIKLENEQQEAQLEDNTDVWSDAKDMDVKDADAIEITLESEPNSATPEEPEPENESATQSQWQELDLLDTEKVEIATTEDSQPETTVVEAQREPELFADRWLEESESDIANFNSEDSKEITTIAVDESEIDALEERKAQLQAEIESLQVQKEQMLLQQIAKAQESIGRIVEEGLQELQERKTGLQIDVEKLERRKERINSEMRRNFAGSSQELAVRVQGFKNYLVGSLQDLAAAAEKLELAKKEAPPSRSRERERERGDEPGRVNRRDRERVRDRSDRRSRNTAAQSDPTQFSEPTFAEQGRRIRQLLDKYRNSPDYYGSPWQLRRTFEPNHAKRVQDWFFTQGGRGAVDSMGSRLQNILVASAAISVLHNLHGDRCRVLVLTDTPENLGEWRRGLQDCLGIPRSSFGANRGVVLFDSPEVLVQAADRLIKDKLLPVIVVDETEELLNLSVLKFPLWLAFASTGKSTPSNYLY